MPVQRTRGRAFAPWAAVGIAIAAPLLVVPWPPSSDLSSYEGMVALLARWGDPTFAPHDVYALALGHDNQLVYALAVPIALVVGTGWACKILLAAGVAAAIAFAARLAEHEGKTPWAALAIAPAAFGWAVYWGFLAQVVGFALVLAALPLLDRAAERASTRSAVQASGAMVVLGLAHASSMICGGIATVVLALVRGVDRRTPIRLVPAAVGAVLALGEMRWDDRVSTPLAKLFASQVLWHPLASKLRSSGSYLIGAHGLLAEGTLALLLIVAAGLWRMTPRDEAPADPAPWPVRHRFGVLAGVLFALYLAAPYSVNFGAFLYVRFLAPAYALAVIAMAPRLGARGPTVWAPAVALAALPVVAAVPQLAAARRQWDDVAPLVERIDTGSAVAVLHFGKHDRSLLFDPTSFGNRVLAARGGRLLYSFAEYPVAPVVVRPEVSWDATLIRVTAQPGALRPAHDLARLRWILVHVRDEWLTARIVAGLAPEGELVGARGEWLLFRSTLPALPLASRDDDAPPGDETLQERVARLSR
jgi:hypothetical protein